MYCTVCAKPNVEETVTGYLGLLGYIYYILLQNVMAAFFCCEILCLFASYNLALVDSSVFWIFVVILCSLTRNHPWLQQNNHGFNFVAKCGGDSLVSNEYVHPVDAEVKFYKYNFPVLFWECFESNTNHALLIFLTSNFNKCNVRF